MTYYLLEWRYEHEEDVEIFHDLTTLAGTLQLELETAYQYDGIYDVKYMGIYEAGTLTPLALVACQLVPEEDGWIDQHYAIRDPHLETVTTFIVRVDERNRQ